MKQFLKYVLATVTGIILVSVIIGIISVISLVGLAAASVSTTVVEDNSVMVVKLSGMMEERAEENPIGMLTGQVSDGIGLDQLLSAISKAKDCEQIKGIYIEAGLFSSDAPASTHAVREALLDFKKSGKWIVAYADSYEQSTYYICSVADKVFLNPQGMIDWHGLGANPMFLKDVLAKFGVKVQLSKVGKYKSAPETLTADGMSEANREQVSAYMNGIWQVMLQEVSASRKIPVDTLNAYADRFMALADQQEYVKAKLVDKLMYTDEVKAEVKKMLKTDADEEIHQLTISDMAGVEGQKEKGDQVAVYYAYGEIEDTRASGPQREHNIVSTEVCKDLEKLMNDDDVKAVVLRVNSPGGSAYASEQIWRAVTQLKAKKPVVVSMGGYAASGGYYISCAANHIMAEPTTITGSIGIFGMFPDFSGLLTEKLGVKFDEVKTNKHAAFGTIARPFNDEEMALLNEYVGRGYELLRQRVADGRKQSVEAIEEVAQGRVWLANDALKIKLVDEIGGLDKAIEKAAKLAKLSEYHAKSYPETTGWLESLLEMTSSKGSYLDEQMKATLGDYYEPFSYLKTINQRNAIQARLPYYLIIN